MSSQDSREEEHVLSGEPSTLVYPEPESATPNSLPALHSCTGLLSESQTERSVCSHSQNKERITILETLSQKVSRQRSETKATHQHQATSKIPAQEMSKVTLPYCFIDQIQCKREEGCTYVNAKHDITVEVKPGEIPEGIIINMEIAVVQRGPFEFPSGTRPVSPILWLCFNPKFQFIEPVLRVTMPHYIQCENNRECKCLGFLKADHTTVGGKFQFRQADGHHSFEPHINCGTLSTNHCCLLCIKADLAELDPSRINYALHTAIPRTLDNPSWNIYFCITYLLPNCKQTVEEQLGGSCVFQLPRKFRMSSSTVGISLEKLQYQWEAGITSSKQIHDSQVDFWRIWESDPFELERLEETKLYPPKFEVRVCRGIGSCVLHVRFSGAEQPETCETVEIDIPFPSTIGNESSGTSLSIITMTNEAVTLDSCTDSVVHLKHLIMELSEVDDWFHFGLHLGVNHAKLKEIENSHHFSTKRCKTEMLHACLSDCYPTWATVVDALRLVGKGQLADTIATKYGVNK